MTMSARDWLRANRCNFVFFFNDTATTEIYTLSLHDALPNCPVAPGWTLIVMRSECLPTSRSWAGDRSEEHTSELQSQSNLVCRLLLEKKKTENVVAGDGDAIDTD